jgi:hypothetical protein
VVCASRFYKAFERTGCLISVNEVGDEHIKPEGLGDEFWKTIRKAPPEEFIIHFDDSDEDTDSEAGDSEMEWTDDEAEEDAPPSGGFSYVEAMIEDLDAAEDSDNGGAEVQFIADQPQPRFADLSADLEAHKVAKLFASKQAALLKATKKAKLGTKEYDKLEAEAREEVFAAAAAAAGGRSRRGTEAARAGKGYYDDNV